MKQDRNFDTLIDRFESRIYDSLKGELRLKLLKEDLASFHDATSLDLWDAGCGFAQIGQWFAEAGHQLTLNDLSQKMLDQAQQNFLAADLKGQFYHGAAQSLANDLPQFDLVLFHAVLEWLAEPLPTLKTVASKVKQNGHLSLLFYNRNSMVWSNVLKGQWRWQFLLNDSYLGKGSKLTPPNPMYPEEVIAALEAWGFEVTIQTGVRVFHDYLTSEVKKTSDLEQLLDLEYRYCRHPTYRHMARYVHLLAKKKA